MTQSLLLSAALLLASATVAVANDCDKLPTHAELKTALKESVAQQNGWLGLPMWASVVDRSGVVCAVAYSGSAVGDQWPGSRVISAQKANTANGFSLKGLALSTANLYAPTQPGGFAFGIQESNPVDVSVAYAGDAEDFGTTSDPMVGKRIGGINVFGGGLALYDSTGTIVGGLGTSGDSSCADHNISWRMRASLKLDYVPSGVAADKTDMIVFDIAGGKSKGGFGHPTCGGTEHEVAKLLPKVAKAVTTTP